MKTLLIMRHAKSSWKDPGLDDHDRPLKKRGRRNARRMGRWLRDEDLAPDVVLCSTALRATLTAERVLKACDFDGEIRVDGTLYHGARRDIIKLIAGAPDDAQRVMIIGHNPGLEDLLERLTGGYNALPTAAIACIELPIMHWSELRTDSRGGLRHLVRPREFDD